MNATALNLLLLHLLFCALGALLLRRLHAPSQPTDWAGVRWLAAYPLGLVPNLIAAFVANQFLGLAISPPVLLAIASALLVITALIVPRDSERNTLPPQPGQGRWSVGEGALLFGVGAVLALRHGFSEPLSDWDSLMYHLPLAEIVRGGHFPDEIGRSYVRQYEAAFPPLLYFLYGLLPGSLSVIGARALAFLVNIGLCTISSHVTQKILGRSRNWGLVAAAATASLVNTEPNTQGITALFFGLTFIFALDAFEPMTADRVAGAALSTRRRLPLVALLGAGCYWTSYLGVGLLAVLYPAIALGAGGRRWRGHRVSFDWAGWLGTGVATLLLLTPHLLRNLQVAGNPIYPAFAEVLGGIGFSESFLANRPPAGTPIEHPWQLIALSFSTWRPLPQWIVAGAASALLLHSPTPGRRTQLSLLLGGFFLVWMTLYQRHNTPLDRYLIPMAPIATATVASLVSRVERHRNLRALVWMIPVLGVLATALISPFRARSTPVPAPLFLLYLAACTLLPWMLERWWTRNAGAAGDEVLAPGRTLFAGLELKASLLLVSAALFSLGILIHDSRWPEANLHRAPIAEDLEWMNDHLPSSSRILIFDGRTLGLEREILAIDDLRLEAFMQAKRPVAARKALEQLGITHFYYSAEAANLLPRDFRLDFFVPRDRNKRTRLVHQSPTGWIVELR